MIEGIVGEGGKGRAVALSLTLLLASPSCAPPSPPASSVAPTVDSTPPPLDSSAPSASSAPRWASAPPSPSPAASSPAPSPPADAPPRTYEEAVSRGNEALSRSDFAAAERAFGAAYALRQKTPEATLGMGRVHLAEGLLQWADGELANAIPGLPKGPDRARARFELGLAYERSARPALARRAFQSSRADARTPEVEDKLSGRTKCFARIDRTVRPSRRFASFLEAQRALDPTPEGTTPPANDEEARRSMLIFSCAAPGCLGRGGMSDWHVFVPTASGVLVFERVAVSAPYRCGGAFGATMKAHGDVLHARLEASYGEFTGGCGDGPWRVVDVVMKVGRGETVLVVDRMGQAGSEPGKSVVEVGETGVKLGAGCGGDVAF